MERHVSTSASAPTAATEVTDRSAAALLLDPARLRFLWPFMLGERSTAAAANDVGVSVKDMAYRIKRMLALDLLHVTREQKRAGRPVRYYRAPSAFFVPFSTTPDTDLEGMVETLLKGPQSRLIAGLAQTIADTEPDVHRWGWRLELDAEQRVSIRPSPGPEADEPLFRRPLDHDSPALYVANLVLWLRHEDAKDLQRELDELVERYDGRNGPDAYMLTIGLTPSGTE